LLSKTPHSEPPHDLLALLEIVDLFSVRPNRVLYKPSFDWLLFPCSQNDPKSCSPCAPFIGVALLLHYAIYVFRALLPCEDDQVVAKYESSIRLQGDPRLYQPKLKETHPYKQAFNYKDQSPLELFDFTYFTVFDLQVMQCYLQVQSSYEAPPFAPPTPSRNHQQMPKMSTPTNQARCRTLLIPCSIPICCVYQSRAILRNPSLFPSTPRLQHVHTQFAQPAA
jgi:hypothetical protein